MGCGGSIIIKLQLLDDVDSSDWRGFKSLRAAVARAIRFVSFDDDRLALLSMPDRTTFGFLKSGDAIDIRNYSHPGEDIPIHLRPRFFSEREIVVERNSERLARMVRSLGREVSISTAPEFV